ncbi:unnamed protein product [Pleuronectes platessa]|uniref:Uncharacterized protein n=1 Tax=Pleuronectes platessa TaxID=8262 RepID=A0A9N7VHS2_PLEPL|nr:unnamed protein product [Pleuronectes platessa]
MGALRQPRLRDGEGYQKCVWPMRNRCLDRRMKPLSREGNMKSVTPDYHTVENSRSRSSGSHQSHHSNVINIMPAIRGSKANKVSH